MDSAGDANVTGDTNSTNFPTTPGAIQTTHGPGGAPDAFVARLNPTGTALDYSSYLGGRTADNDRATGIAVDSSGAAYVSGWTGSPDFPTTLGAYQSASGGSVDAFLAKLNPGGSRTRGFPALVSHNHRRVPRSTGPPSR